MPDAFTFQTTPNVLFERGAVRKLPELAATFGTARIMLVTDKGVRAAGLTLASETALRNANCDLIVHDDVIADPSSVLVEAAAKRARTEGVGLVLAIGGGSVLDTAKLVAYLARSAVPLETIYGVGLATGARLPLILVPTTAGTGSEVTPIAIVTTPSTEKLGIVSSKLLPDWAVLDPELTLGLGAEATAATGLDAIVHAIEAYTSRHRKNTISDQFARQALQLLSASIRGAVTNGRDIGARSAMLLGSTLAGMAFANAPVAAVHALAYPIGAMFHVPHGLSNALVLTSVLRFNQPYAGALYEELAPLLGPEAVAAPADEPGSRFIEALEAIRRDCAIPASLAEFGVTVADLPRLAEHAMKQTRLLANNPREMTYEDALRIYTEVFERVRGSPSEH